MPAEVNPYRSPRTPDADGPGRRKPFWVMALLFSSWLCVASFLAHDVLRIHWSPVRESYQLSTLHCLVGLGSTGFVFTCISAMGWLSARRRKRPSGLLPGELP